MPAAIAIRWKPAGAASSPSKMSARNPSGALLRPSVKAAREANLRRLGYAVMNHFDRDLQRTLTRNEDDAAPVGVLHGRQTEAGKTRAAQDVHLEEPHPVRVLNL